MKLISGATLLCFLMICFTINILHATPTEIINIMNYDYRECLRQIEFAYKSDKCTNCFKYAVEHYKKGKNISVGESYFPGQSQNFASTSGISQNTANPSSYNRNFDGQMYGGQDSINYLDPSSYDRSFNGQLYGGQDSINYLNPNSNERSFEGDLYNTQDDTNLEEISKYFGNFDGSHDYTDRTSYMPRFDEQMYIDQDQYNNDQSFNGQFYSGQEDTNLEDLSHYVSSFEGLKDFIEKDTTINNHGFTEQIINDQDPQNNVIIIDEESSENKDELQYSPNYATAYFTELESLVEDNKFHGVMPAKQYCRKIFDGDDDCFSALKIFGDDLAFPNYAVQIALTTFKLTECDDTYIISYMKHIINKVKIALPSKRPQKFCLEIFDNTKWYQELKSLIKINI